MTPDRRPGSASRVAPASASRRGGRLWDASRRGLLVALALVMAGFVEVAVAPLVAPPPVAAADPSCSTTNGPADAYTATVCLDVPAGPLGGTVAIGANVTLSRALTFATSLTFCLDGSTSGPDSCLDGGPGYVLRTFHATANPRHGATTWAFSLPTGHWPDGRHALLVVAALADGTQTAPATVDVTFANGLAAQPKNAAAPSFVRPTRPKAGSPLVVGATGDAGGDDPTAGRLGRLISGWSPNLFLYLGDVYDRGSYAEFTNWYGRTFGSLRPITAPVPGNHEYLSASDPATAEHVVPPGTAYFDYWNNLPNYYSFDAGGWHFIALNANPQMGRERWDEQLNWLAADQADHASACTIAFWHEPAFTTGTAGVTPEAQKLWSLVDGHATLVLNAHDHTYQRWTPLDAAGRPSGRGTVEVVAGTGEHTDGTFVSKDSRQLARSTTPGALRLELTRSTARVEYVTTAGTVADSASVRCLGGGGASRGAGAGAAGAGAAGGTNGTGSGGAGSPTNGPGQLALQLSLLLAILLAVAGYALAGPSLVVAVGLLLASVGALALAAAGLVPAAAGPFATVGIALGGGLVVGRLLPQRAGGTLLLLAAAAGAEAALAVAVEAAPPTAGAWRSLVESSGGSVAVEGTAFRLTALDVALALVGGCLVVAVAVHARRRRLPHAASVVPAVVAVVLADALAFALPAAAPFAAARGAHPGVAPSLLLAPLLLVGWIVTEILLRASHRPGVTSASRRDGGALAS